jgi:alcohol dehydrogenase
VPGGSDDAAGRARAAVRAVADLLASIGIPRTLADLGVPSDRLPEMARDAMSARRLVENNPRLLDEEAALDVLTAAYAGDLRVLGECISRTSATSPVAQPLGGAA